MKEETTSNRVNIQLPPKPEDGGNPYGIPYEGDPPYPTALHVLRQALIESQEPYQPKLVTPKEPSAAPIVLGLFLFLISVAGLLSVGLWYAWPSIQKYAQEKGWTEPKAEPKEPPAAAAAPASEKVTYYHVSCVAQLETGRINFHEFHYSLADGEPVNPLLLIHNLRDHAAQLTGSSNVIILAVSTLPGGAK